MLNQSRQAGMRDILNRGDLALYPNLLIAMEVQLQSYNVISRGAVWLQGSGCLEDYPLTTNGNLGADDESAT
jgi:hypothetical protein